MVSLISLGLLAVAQNGRNALICWAGLAIVTDIADTWGGTLSFEKLETGFRVDLRLPPARRSARAARK